MNILASHNWIKEYLDSKDSIEQFDQQMSLTGSSVEYIHRGIEVFDKMVVGQIKELKKHPDANALQIAVTDIGKESVEIVCGGSNLREGMKVFVALPGSKVRWHGEGDLVELGKAKVRGVESYGMICAPAEIGFEKLQQGEKYIWDLTDLTDAKAGTSVVKALELDDTIFDIEATTNRPDQMSIIGLAREAGAVGLGKFKWAADKSKKKVSTHLEVVGQELPLKVTVKDSKLCPRYQAVVIDGVKVGPSPWWLQKRLLQAGHRPFNNIVDITNYVLHEYGQPMHTFDYQKLEGGEIIIRTAKKGEKFLALDDEKYELSDSNLVIADAKQVVAVAGVMGGKESGTTEKTTTIVFECASFEPVQVRRTARDLNLYSDSQLLFEKGLSTEATEPALMRAIELTLDIAGGRVASEVFDQRAGKYETFKFPFSPKDASALIGVEIPEAKQMGILGNLGFTAKKTGDHYQVSVPYWRDYDIEASVDFVEEIARIYGYQNMPSRLPAGELPSVSWEPEFVWQRRVKDILVAAGATEAYSESFISEADLKNYNLSTKEALRLQNPLSSDLEYLRPNLVPAMLQSIEANQRDFSKATLFELARTFNLQKDGLPKEELRLLLASYQADGEQAFLRVKGLLERLLREAGVSGLVLKREIKDSRWHVGRSAVIHVNDHEVGVIGEISRSVAEAFGLETRVSLAYLDFNALLPHLSINKKYTPTPEFPEVKRDLAFVVKSRVEFEDLKNSLIDADRLVRRIELFDVYSGKGIEDGCKSMAVHLEIRAKDRTLKSDEIDKVMSKVVQVIEKDFNGKIRK